jgi:hypothetical protein
MKTENKPKVALKLSRQKDKHGKKQWVLPYGRFNKDGELVWAATDWEIQATSLLPRTIFGLLKGYIFRRIPKQDKSFGTMEGKIRSALCEAASACSCKFKENRYGGFTWLLDGKPLLALAVVDFEKHRAKSWGKLAQQLREHRPNHFERMERKSGATLRMAVVVVKGGSFLLVPAATLPEEKRHG